MERTVISKIVVTITVLIAGVRSIVINPAVPFLTITGGGLFEISCVNEVPVIWAYPDHAKNETQANEEDIQDNMVGFQSSRLNISHTWSSEGNYVSQLSLRDVSYLDVGYFHCTSEGNDAQRASIYLYVDDEEHLLSISEEEMLSPIFISQSESGDVVIPCKPTMPDVNVTLKRASEEETSEWEYDSKVGFTLETELVTVSHAESYECEATRDNISISAAFEVIITGSFGKFDLMPYIDSKGANHVVEGGLAVLNCTVDTDSMALYTFIEWIVVNKSERVNITAQKGVPFVIGEERKVRHFITLIIRNATREDSGEYKCVVSDNQGNSRSTSFNLTIKDPNFFFLDLNLQGNKSELIVEAGRPSVQWVVNVQSHPPANVTWLDAELKEIAKGYSRTNKFMATYDGQQTKLIVYNVNMADSGVYSVHAVNPKGMWRYINVTLLVKDKPRVRLDPVHLREYYRVGSVNEMHCIIDSYPVPVVRWLTKKCDPNSECLPTDLSVEPESEVEQESLNQVKLISKYKFTVEHSFWLVCEATNENGTANASAKILATDVEDGFSVWGPDLIAEGDNITLSCAASSYDYKNVTWIYMNYTDALFVKNSTDLSIVNAETEFSLQSTLHFDNISKSRSGEYYCQAFKKAPSVDYYAKNVTVKVLDLQFPKFDEVRSSINGSTEKVETGKSVEWKCVVIAVPKAFITWYKDGKLLQPNTSDSRIEMRNNNETLLIRFAALGDDGTYTCIATNRLGNISETNTLVLTDKPEHHEHFGFILVCSALAVFCIICLIYLAVKIQHERKLKKDLAATGLLHFEEGLVGSLNPDLGVEDQADLLPYDKRWEFPREKLKLGKQLGSGAFGVVMKAQADGIIDPNTSTTVAVKMVKRGADPLYIKALASELKIMIHLGRHLNVVNLLGACTRDISKRELVVIVEYCRFGNLHDFLLKQRSNYIHQVDPVTGKLDPSMSTSLKKKNLYDTPPSISNGSVFTSATNSQGNATSVTTETTLIGTDGYLLNKDAEPDWRSNYKGDYRNATVNPIRTCDLICWAFQIARGMEYLASRKVLHGDLAARNVLLADDNIVKICDFGLAKSMYNSDNYQRRQHELLPVRWMAIESIRDRVFSTQSDVWSFGVVLWEMFSLSVTPYPGIEHLEVLYTKLVEGYRMEEPAYATTEMYNIMKDCWHARPGLRPSFTELADRLGGMLEDGLRSQAL